MLVHLALVASAIAIVVSTGPIEDPPFFESRSGHAILVGLGLIALAWLLVRLGARAPGIGLYVATTAAVALATALLPEPHVQIGLFASAVIPIVLTATAFSTRTTVTVWVLVVGVGVAVLAASSMRPATLSIAQAELVVVAVTGGLILVLRRHIAQLARAQAEEMLARERALQSAGERYRRLFEIVGDGVFVANAALELVEVNASACRQLGYAREELLGLRLDALATPPDAALRDAIARVRAGVPVLYETGHRHRDGRVVPVEVALSADEYQGAPAFIAIARDVSERQRLEAQLHRAARMESVGRLASGVAHDMNNILTVITGNLELARLELDRGSAAAAYFDHMSTAVVSAAGLTRQLLTFSRRQVIAPRSLDPGELLARAKSMFERLIGENVRLRMAVAPGIGAVHADPGLIEQVLVNLVVNARDAMPNGGELVIEAANTTLDEEYVRRHSEASAGRHVMLVVTDTGVGMSPDVLAHIFEPFFTTKAAEHGTGLGLATSYGAVKQSGGSIEVYSEPGRGTTFRIYLPRVDAPTVSLAGAPRRESVPRGRETVLVVEDDAGVRELAIRTLHHLGYRVLEAGDGASALTLAAAHPEVIHLLLTDVIMPGMNGRELASALIGMRPAMKVLYTSGYPENVIAHHGVLAEGICYLGKPYGVEALALKIREVLDAVR